MYYIFIFIVPTTPATTRKALTSFALTKMITTTTPPTKPVTRPPGECFSADEYQCQDYSCVKSIQRCDGFSDCSDHSDEYGCLSK